MSPRVLVTDGDQRAALACVRSLGKAGFECFVTGPGRSNLAGASRHCRGVAVAPDPASDSQAFLTCLLEHAFRWRIEYLLPITEKSLRVVLREVELFSPIKIPFPALEVFERVSDKAQVLEAAQRVGIGIPNQWEWRCRDEAERHKIRNEEFPLVVKPTKSVVKRDVGLTQMSVEHVADSADLERWVATAGEESFPVLVQERVKGEGIGVFVLLWDGALHAVAGHRRIREKPPSGGVSVLRESTVVDPGLLRKSLGLLGELGWDRGVAMVEYKVEPETGQAWLMEINGRFWGSLQLAVDAGVDFPALLLQCSRGEPPGDPVTGRPGVRTRWLMGDVDQLLMRLFRSREALHLPASLSGRGRAILEFLWDFRPGIRQEVLRLSDPRPFVTEAGAWLRSLISHGTDP